MVLDINKDLSLKDKILLDKEKKEYQYKHKNGLMKILIFESEFGRLIRFFHYDKKEKNNWKLIDIEDIIREKVVSK